MATKTTRRGSWRKVAPGQYVKSIGTYGNVAFGATARVSFVPFPTCEIVDANGVHAAIPAPADEKKFIAAAKKVYTKDMATGATKAQKRAAVRTPSSHKKWKPPSQNMYGLTDVIKDPYSPSMPAREARAEKKLASTDEARRTKAHNIWLSGKEPGTPRDIYLRLYAADSKKYRK